MKKWERKGEYIKQGMKIHSSHHKVDEHLVCCDSLYTMIDKLHIRRWLRKWGLVNVRYCRWKALEALYSVGEKRAPVRTKLIPTLSRVKMVLYGRVNMWILKKREGKGPCLSSHRTTLSGCWTQTAMSRTQYNNNTLAILDRVAGGYFCFEMASRTSEALIIIS